MVNICTDSCNDLTSELIEENNIKVIPLVVTLGEQEYYDNVNIHPEDIFNFVNKNNILPKTAARSIEDYKEFFNSLPKENEIIYIGISSELSSSINNAMLASKEVDEGRIFIVDSRSLSTGIGLLVLYAARLAKEGKNGKEIYVMLLKQTQFNQASFIVDRLDYLYKGGRCSGIARFGANLLKLKPCLELVNGEIINTSKYMGNFKKIVYKYIDDMLAKYPNVKKENCFITHTCKDEAFIIEVVEYVRNKNIFEKVYSSRAGSTISCHCGENTLGILYLLEE